MEFHQVTHGVYPARPTTPEELLLVDKLHLLRNFTNDRLERIPALTASVKHVADTSPKSLVYHPWALDNFVSTQGVIDAILAVVKDMRIKQRDSASDAILTYYLGGASRRVSDIQLAVVCMEDPRVTDVILQVVLNSRLPEMLRLTATLLLSQRSTGRVSAPAHALTLLLARGNENASRLMVDLSAGSTLYSDQDILALVPDPKFPHVLKLESARGRRLSIGAYVSLLNESAEAREYAATQIIQTRVPFYLKEVVKHHQVKADLRMQALQLMMTQGAASLPFILGLGMSPSRAPYGNPFVDLVNQVTGSHYAQRYAKTLKVLEAD